MLGFETDLTRKQFEELACRDTPANLRAVANMKSLGYIISHGDLKNFPYKQEMILSFPSGKKIYSLWSWNKREDTWRELPPMADKIPEANFKSWGKSINYIDLYINYYKLTGPEALALLLNIGDERSAIAIAHFYSHISFLGQYIPAEEVSGYSFVEGMTRLYIPGFLDDVLIYYGKPLGQPESVVFSVCESADEYDKPQAFFIYNTIGKATKEVATKIAFGFFLENLLFWDQELGRNTQEPTYPCSKCGRVLHWDDIEGEIWYQALLFSNQVCPDCGGEPEDFKPPTIN